MTTTHSVALVALTTLGAFLGGAGSAHAQSYQHIDQVAWQLRGQTARFASDLRYHYRGLPNYEHLYSDVIEMYRLADHIHEIIHHGEDMDHVVEDVRQIDALFHHVEELVDGIGHPEPYDVHDDYHSHYGYGHYSYGSAHLLEVRMRSIERTLHHLLEDVEQMAGGQAVEPVPANTAPAVGYRGRRFSIRIGGF